MDDYISRDAAIDAFFPVDPENDGSDGATPIYLEQNYSSSEIESILWELPAADVGPVRRIQWTPYADGQTDTSGFATDDDYLLRTSTGYIVPGYWDDQFKEWTVPIEYDAAKDWADRFGQIVGFMKIQRPEDPA